MSQMSDSDVMNRMYATSQRIQVAQEDALRRGLVDYRALYWARHYHVNTRLQRMSFKNLYYLVEMYKAIEKDHNMVVEKSVQCGLSELFIIQSHVEAGEKGMTVMYVLPKYELRNRFVNNRIYKLHKRVNWYGFLVKQAETKVHRTSLMHFGLGTLAYVGSNVSDEFIEIPVDSAYVDEKDRCNQSNLLMIPDRLTASPYKYLREIGNPTTEGFGIDERYLESSQSQWNIKCPRCGQWFVPDFWKHVVREVSANVYVPRDTKADTDPQAFEEIDLIHDCGGSVDRLQWGEWVHAYSRRVWKGYRVSKVFSKFTTLRDMYRVWSKAAGNDLKTQLFYNSDLGLPFSSKGSKITRSLLDSCRRSYEWPVRHVGNEYARLMGVDVGSHLHVVLRERVRTGSGMALRMLGAWTLPGFSQLAELLREWKPACCVIDAMPEIHKVMELKEEFGNVWSSRFQSDATSLVKQKDKREVRMDRTAILDYVRQAFELQNMILPMQAESIESGEYYAHMQASTRILEANEESPEKSRFVWVEGSRPDHFCFIGSTLVTTIHGDVPIQDIRNGDHVLTRYGFREVVCSGTTGEREVSTYTLNDVSITATDSHHVWTEEEGMVELQLLAHKHTCCIISRGDKLVCELSTKLKWYTKELLSEGIQNQKEGLTGFILPQVLLFLRLELGHYTGRYGKISLGTSLKVATFIIKTGILLTTRLITLSALTGIATIATTSKGGIVSIQRRLGLTTSCVKSRYMKNYEHGEKQRRVSSYLKTTLNSCGLTCSHIPVLFALSGLKLAEKLISIVAVRVARSRDAILGLIMKNESAWHAGKSLRLINTIKRVPVQGAVPVYNLTVADHHEYFANGLLVSNCLAEAYCMQAGLLMPEHGLFDFFDQEVKALGAYANVSGVKDTKMSDSQREEIAKLQNLTPEIFLQRTFSQNVNVNPPIPVVDKQKIGDTVKFMHSSQGYVDIALLRAAVNEPEEDILDVLASQGFKESVIRGQYVKQ